MVRRIFQPGDVLNAEDVNAIAYPALTGEDFIGQGDQLPDSDLDDSPDQIKSRFYGFYDRLKVTYNTGLSFNYLGGSVLLSSGSVVSISAGTISLPNNTTSYIYINSVGAVASAATLPNESFPLAKATTLSGVLSGSIIDLRNKLIDRVTPSNIPAVSAFQPGMGMEYWGSTLPSGGWLWQDGSSYPTATYPALFAAIGYTQGGSGANFNVPDKRGRSGVGAGSGSGLTTRSLGEKFGSEAETLNISQTPSHAHGVGETAHTHGTTESPHGHNTSETPHNHGIYLLASTNDQTLGNSPSTGNPDQNPDQPLIGTTGQAVANVVVQAAKTNLSINAAVTNITINNQGGGGPHNNMQPSIVCNYIIKT